MSRLKYSDLRFASVNKQKHAEFSALLELPDLRMARIHIAEPQDMNIHSLVEYKVEKVKEQLPDTPFFVEHTGLIIDAWKGLPGGLIGVFMQTVGNEGICKMIQGFHDQRIARAIVVIGFYHPDHGYSAFQGETVGTIASQPHGKNNFGWDPIFIPEGESKTYGEMSLADKNKTSMRKRACDKFAKALDRYFGSISAQENQLDYHYLRKLHLIIAEHFDEEELEMLCFSLGVAYDDLRGEGKMNKAMELVLYHKRRNLLTNLEKEVTRQRPNISWPSLP